MDFFNLVKNRQSTRSYLNKEVELEKINKILETARFCPSACNSQPWKMVVVRGEEKTLPIKNALIDGAINSFLKDVNTFIALVEEPAVLRAGINVASDYYTEYDIGELIAYITLSAEELGVSSCIIGRVNQEIIKNALNLTENEKCKIVIALGYSNAIKREKTRKSFQDVVEYL